MNIDLQSVGVFIFISAILIWPNASLYAEPDQPLFQYHDHVITVSDLTLVTYADSLREITSLKEHFPSSDYSTSTPGYLAPAVDALPDPHVAYTDFYNHALNGVIETFVRAEVLQLFRKNHPVSTERYYNPDKFKLATATYTTLTCRFFSANTEGLLHCSSSKDFAEYMRSVFPKCTFPDQTWVEMYAVTKKQLPYRLIVARCTPWVKNGKTAPWAQQLCDSGLLLYYVEAEIDRDKPHYIDLLEERFGLTHFFVIHKAIRSRNKDVESLINTFTTPNGDIALGGLEQINTRLKKLELPTYVELYRGNYLYIESLFKASPDDIHPKKFIQATDSEGKEPVLIYIYQLKPTPHFQEYPTAPPSFLYDLAQAKLIRPLVEEVLHNLKLAPPFRVRSVDQLVPAVRGHYFPSDLYGEPIEKFAVK